MRIWLFSITALWLSCTAASAAAPDVRLLLPPVIYALPGVEANVYFDNIALVLNRRSYAFDAVCSKGMQLDERWTFTPKVADVGEHPIEIVLRDESNAVIARAKSVVRVVPADKPTNQVMTLLLVGASNTQRSVYPQHLLDLDEKDEAFGLKLIGCRGPDNAPATGALRHEGYNGWTAEAFATMHGPLSRSGQFKRPETGSPFVYADEGAKPHLDFARYCKEFNDGKGPDAITIWLGTNDIFRESDETIDARVEKVLTFHDQLIAAFHKARADTHIGVLLTPLPTLSQNGFRNYAGPRRQTRWQVRRNLHRLLERMVARYSGREAEHIYLVPTYANLDTERGYPTFTAPANARAAEKIARVNDGVHLSQEGYEQIGDSIYCWLKAVTLPAAP